jgi:hypothetical protein
MNFINLQNDPYHFNASLSAAFILVVKGSLPSKRENTIPVRNLDAGLNDRLFFFTFTFQHSLLPSSSLLSGKGERGYRPIVLQYMYYALLAIGKNNLNSGGSSSSEYNLF